MKSQNINLLITAQHSRLLVRTHIQVGDACKECKKKGEGYKKVCNNLLTVQNRDDCYNAVNQFVEECRTKLNCSEDEY